MDYWAGGQSVCWPPPKLLVGGGGGPGPPLPMPMLVDFVGSEFLANGRFKKKCETVRST